MFNNNILKNIDLNTLIQKYLTKRNIIIVSILFFIILILISFRLWQNKQQENIQLQLSNRYNDLTQAYKDNEFKKAENIIENMYNINPQSYYYIFAKLLQAKNYAQQKNELNKAIEIYKILIATSNIKTEIKTFIQYQLAKVYYDKGDLEDAYETALDAQDNTSKFKVILLNLLGDISLKQKNTQQAISYYNEAKDNNEVDSRFLNQYINLKLQNLTNL